MHSETPQILPENPGEPGGEKARKITEELTGLLAVLSTERLKIIERALAACALAELRAWQQQWRKEALEMVDPYYARRGLHQKYLKLDNMAAGIDACADDLVDRIAALERAVEGKA